MVKFIELNTIGVSKDSQLRAAKLLKVVSDGYELERADEHTDRLFDFGRRIMAARWERLREVVKASGIFSLPEFPDGFCEFTKERTGIYPGMYVNFCSVSNSFIILYLITSIFSPLNEG